jgi:hypothetical protein
MLSDLGRKQLPFATAMALNDTAESVKRVEELEIDRAFDRPTPFTRRALYMRRASKGRLTAQVGVKSLQAKYLKLQATGGVRRPAGSALVVPVSARKNKYGNLARGAVKKSLKRADVFVAGKRRGKTGHLRAGVYQRPKRSGQPLKLLVAFEPRAEYSPRWDFQSLAMRRASGVFPDRFKARLVQAIRSAK